MDMDEQNFQEGVFSGVMGVLEYQGYSGNALREELIKVLKNMMNWTQDQIEEALVEVEWMLSDNS